LKASDYNSHEEVTIVVSVSVSELKAKLSEHLRRVKSGEQVVVTERGRAVAVISPPPRSDELDPDVVELVDAGLMRLGRGSVSPRFWELPMGRDPNDAALKALLRERAEGR
jgi:prevent-host-death family protein